MPTLTGLEPSTLGRPAFYPHKFCYAHTKLEICAVTLFEFHRTHIERFSLRTKSF